MDLLNTNKAKQITLGFFLFLLLPIISFAQITTTLSERSYYYVVVNGDTLSQHNRLDKAIESATEIVPNGTWEIVQDFRLSGSSYFIEETYEIIDSVRVDTVFVEIPSDTVYADTLEVPVYSMNDPDHIIMIRNIDFSLDRDSVSGNQTIDFTITTQPDETDTLLSEIRCGNEWVSNNQFTNPEEVFVYGLLWDCDSRLTYSFTAINDNGWEQTVTNTYPLFMTEAEQWNDGAQDSSETSDLSTDFSDPEILTQWTQTWGSLLYDIDDLNDRLVLTLPERSIARVRWDKIPQHRNIRVSITETVDESHGTGIHLGLRSSEAPQEGAIETYLNQDGIGVSVFQNGSWSNPSNFPIYWEYGVPISYTVELIDNTLAVIHEGSRWVHVDNELLDIPAGRLMLGSTGAGTYYVDQIEVEILD